ncbi:histidine triad (HIT) protein [Coriobacterium glomerans PW2]|uniref:Histidine triad (HIT) protein n=1 Tax=Coriobacterium glomerans (strain ATCC 49209 / DSM 20642 / JCM 10262 / PW2) TaxID=700015 RepID=F2NBP5_CORGP|nr:HIT domain-containing protein [Coriobacterium glomerans]AEB06854.1 histidine triad (HIT) protein [Coriobacterium glomerans PW2]
MQDCIFCRIAAHEITARVVYEDDEVIAFDDNSPQAPVHTLVVPKHHYDSIIDDVPGETLAAMARAVRVVAERKGLKDGFRVITNTGEAAGQTVGHLHFHVLGGKDLAAKLI